MPIAVNVPLPLSTKDPREAIAECLRLVRASTVNLEALQIDLGLICTANREVLIRLAKQLPADTLGFSVMGGDRAITARQFQGENSEGFSAFNGNLTEHLLPTDAFALIEQLLQSPAQAIRSTAFNLTIRNIHWKGSPLEGIGSLHMLDLKAFKRAQRFSSSVGLQIPGDNAKSTEVQDVFKRVAQATKIPFATGKALRVMGDKGCTPALAQATLLGQICFEEAIENLTAQLPRRWISECGPNALSPSDAFTLRFQQWGGVPSGKVNLPSQVKRTAKRILPDLLFESAEPDQIVFKKGLGPGSELLVLFVKALPRIGKAFTISLGIRSIAEGIRFTADVFQLERTTERRTWIYADAAEAESAINEALNLIKDLLPRFEFSLRRYFEPWPKELPVGIEKHGNLTAQEALAKAEPFARGLFPDAKLIRLFNHPISLTARDIEGPELSLDGRLTKNAMWWFHFYSAERDASFQVTVPAAGSIRILDHGKQYQDNNARYILVPVETNWIDSNQALALAEERGGRERRSSGNTFGIMAKMQMSRSQRAYWAVMYLVVDARGRNDLIVNLDATTGEAISDIPGF